MFKTGKRIDFNKFDISVPATVTAASSVAKQPSPSAAIPPMIPALSKSIYTMCGARYFCIS